MPDYVGYGKIIVEETKFTKELPVLVLVIFRNFRAFRGPLHYPLALRVCRVPACAGMTGGDTKTGEPGLIRIPLVLRTF